MAYSVMPMPCSATRKNPSGTKALMSQRPGRPPGSGEDSEISQDMRTKSSDCQVMNNIVGTTIRAGSKMSIQRFRRRP